MPQRTQKRSRKNLTHAFKYQTKVVRSAIPLWEAKAWRTWSTYDIVVKDPVTKEETILTKYFVMVHVLLQHARGFAEEWVKRADKVYDLSTDPNIVRNEKETAQHLKDLAYVASQKLRNPKFNPDAKSEWVLHASRIGVQHNGKPAETRKTVHRKLYRAIYDKVVDPLATPQRSDTQYRLSDQAFRELMADRTHFDPTLMLTAPDFIKVNEV